MSDEDVISPPESTVNVQGREIVLTPIKVKALPKVVRALRPIMSGLPEEITAADMMDLYLENSDAVTEAIAAMACMTVDEVEDLQIDDAVSLLTACVEINRDFFTQTLPGMLNQVGAGPTP